jgi:hypothetical protein
MWYVQPPDGALTATWYGVPTGGGGAVTVFAPLPVSAVELTMFLMADPAAVSNRATKVPVVPAGHV